MLFGKKIRAFTPRRTRIVITARMPRTNDKLIDDGTQNRYEPRRTICAVCEISLWRSGIQITDHRKMTRAEEQDLLTDEAVDILANGGIFSSTI